MKRIYHSLLALAACLLCTTSGWAETFEEGGITYNTLSETAVEVTAGTYSGPIVIPATVVHDGVTYNVTQIANSAFRNNSSVTSLKLPSSVTTLVNTECLSGMTALTYLEIPNVNTLPAKAMINCTSLRELVLGEGVQWMGALMADGCTAIQIVRIQNSTPPGYNHSTETYGTYAHQCRPIPRNIQQNATLYVPKGSVSAYQTKAASGINNAHTTLLYDRFNIVEMPAVDVESITIAPENPVLAAEEGATVQLTATVLPEDATDKTIVWSTSDASIATVSNTGLVTRTAPLINDGDQPYTVTITATGANDVVATVTVTAEVLANVPVASITIEPENPVLAAEAGATVQLTATPLPENALDKTITWSSTDETVATVNATGLVTRTAPLINDGDQPFTVVITATAASGVTQTVTVTAEVLANIPVSSIEITPAEPVLAAEASATVQLTATPLPENALDKTITWSTSDANVATVSSAGLVTRVAPLYNDNVPFTVDITATAASGVSQTVTVTAQVLETVYPTALSISPEAPVLTAEAGATVQLTAVFDPETTTERAVTWSSADETIATVDQNGLVTRTAPLTSEDEQPYTVVITATTPNGLTANVTVTANVKGDDFFCENGIYYNVLSADDLTVEVTNSIGGTGNDIGCYSGDIEIPVTVTHKNRTYRVIRIGNYAFGASGSGFSAGTSVTSLKLNEGLLSIADYALRGMGGISELVLPSTVTEIPAFALGRISAETIVIPNARVIGMSALSGCSNLKHLVLGEGVQILNNNMTKDVTTVEDVTCLATTPPTWDGSVANFAPFAGFINTAKLYVPEGSINAYRNAASSGIYYWRFSTIEEYVPVVVERVHIAETEHGAVTADNLNPADGATVTLTVTPDNGYKLENIKVEAIIDPENAHAPRRIDGPGVGLPVELTTVTEGQTYTFVMPDAPYEVLVTSEFAIAEYTITVAETQNGTVEAPETAHAGDNVAVTATPAQGYELTALTYTVEGADPVTIENGAFTMPAANVTINATFTAINYTITIAETQNGTVEAPETANFGDNVTVTATPAQGYELTALTYTVEGADPVTIENGAFTMPAANVTINATFTAINYTITVAETQNGTVEAPETAHFGETVTLTITPAEGYELASLTVMAGDTPVSVTEENTFVMPAANVTVTAEFQFTPIVLDGVVFAGNTYATWYGNRDLALPEGVTAYVVTGIEGDATQIEPVDYIPANVGVLLYSTISAETVSTVPYTGETVSVTSMLQGSVESMDISDGYVLYNDVFVRILNGSLAAHRCYLPVANPNGAPMRLRIVNNDIDIVTAINDVRVATDGQVRYIDVNGRVSDRPFNGINIVVSADGTVTKMVK